MLENQPNQLIHFVQPKETSCVALFTRWGGYKRIKVKSSSLVASSREHFDYTVTAAADDPSAVAAPGGRTDAFATHQPVACDFLGTASLLEVPEAEACVVTCGDELAAVWGERKRGNGCRVGKHGVCALT